MTPDELQQITNAAKLAAGEACTAAVRPIEAKLDILGRQMSDGAVTMASQGKDIESLQRDRDHNDADHKDLNIKLRDHETVIGRHEGSIRSLEEMRKKRHQQRNDNDDSTPSTGASAVSRVPWWLREAIKPAIYVITGGALTFVLKGGLSWILTGTGS